MTSRWIRTRDIPTTDRATNIVTTAEGLKAVADIANNGNLGINITLTENINLTDME